MKEVFSTLPICSIFCQTHETAVWHQHCLWCSALSCIDLSANLDEAVLDCRWIVRQVKAVLLRTTCMCDWQPPRTHTAWDLQAGNAIRPPPLCPLFRDPSPYSFSQEILLTLWPVSAQPEEPTGLHVGRWVFLCCLLLHPLLLIPYPHPALVHPQFPL